MKLFVSADIEGCCGVTHWDEADRTHADGHEFRRRMTAETRAVCEGALAAGVTEILIKDAHASGRNLLHEELPRECRLVRAWSGHPHSMVTGIDESFDVAIFVGYHARAGAGGNPLAHTMSSSAIYEIRIGGVAASEFRLHAFACARLGVPVVMISGDAEICREAQQFRSCIHTVPTKTGYGSATLNEHPDVVLERLRAVAAEAVQDPAARTTPKLASEWRLEVRYKDQQLAYRRSFYPGARLEGPRLVCFEHHDYFEILRAVQFLT